VHFTAGVLTAFASIISPVLAAIMAVIFIVYELDEDWKLNDNAYKDILQYACGLYFAAVIIMFFQNV
jgi:hypothetical protein